MKQSEWTDGPSVTIAPDGDEAIDLELTEEAVIDRPAQPDPESKPPPKPVPEPARPTPRRKPFWVKLIYLLVFLAVLIGGLSVYATVTRIGQAPVQVLERLNNLEDKVRFLEERIRVLEEKQAP